MDDPTYTYFCENIEAISKEELLTALKGALQSASHWRNACLIGLTAAQLKSGDGTDTLSSKMGQTA